MQERVAKLETNVENIKANVQRVEQRIERVEQKVDRLDDKIDSVKDSVAALRIETKDANAALSLQMERGFSSLTRWTLLLYIGMGITLLSVIARAFRWV